MKLINPEGSKKIIISNNKKVLIVLEDFASGNRTFELEIFLRGKNAQCEIQGRIVSTNTDKKIWTIRQIFEGKNQVGNIELRGTAEEKSFLQFDGKAEITSKSTEADAQIQEKILLFDDAKGKLLPILTVKTDNVKNASHSAFIAPVNIEQLLYLQSRGISKKKAENVIKEGFLRSFYQKKH
jgi:Fe-S cluster assembly scaffold protein SufB